MFNTQNIRGIIAIFFVYLLATNALAATVDEFFNDLYTRYASAYAEKRKTVYNGFCREFELNASNQNNKKKFYKLYFLHDLFTGSACVDFVQGGILQIPYVWHWIEPNPRHTITYLPEDIPLVQVKPPSEFSRYKSYADIDRIPSLYLKDLFSEHPIYRHPDAGNFYSFGWCSEREMAYASLMNNFGYTCKIKQSDIHVQTEVLTEFVDTKGATVRIVVTVDNSVDYLQWDALDEAVSIHTWKQDVGSGQQIHWYNKVAFSKKEQQWITTTHVEEKQYQWMEKILKQWLEN